MNPSEPQGKRPFGIRFRISVMLLFSALNVVALGTVLVIFSLAYLRDLRPIHRGAWDADQATEAMYLQMMGDALATQVSGERPTFPVARFDELEVDLDGSLGEDAHRLEADVHYFRTTAEQWYLQGLPIPRDTRFVQPGDPSALPADEEGAGGGAAEAPETAPAPDPAVAPEEGVAAPGPDTAVDAAVGGDEVASAPAAPAEVVPGDEFHQMQTAYFLLQEQYAGVMERYLEEGPSRVRPFVAYPIAWVALMALLTIYLAWRLQGLISRPLAQLTTAASAIAEGDLDSDVRLPRGNDELGLLGETIGAMRDDLRRRIRQLKTQNRQMETIFNAMGEGVLLVDHAYKLQEHNVVAARLLGMKGEPLKDGIDVRSLDIEVLSRVVEGESLEKPVDLEIPSEVPASRSRHSRITRRKLLRSDGSSMGYVAVIRDCTEEKEMEQIKNDFFSMVTHELKTPLTTIEGYVKLLARGRPDPVSDEQRRVLAIVSAQTDLVKRMVQDLLDISRISAGRLSLDPQPFDVSALLEKVGEQSKPAADDQGVKLDLRGPEGGPVTVTGDAVRLEQVFGNLVTNAIKFTPAGGKIDVAWRRGGGMLRVTVADTGKGIPRAALPRIFDKFYQVEQGDTRSAGGVGLGLYIAREIARAHGGDIAVSSVVHEGSTFTVEIPLEG